MKVYGKEYVIVTIVFIIVAVASLILSKKFLKTEKQRSVYIKIIAALALINVILCRIGITLINEFKYIIPTSLCAMTSFVFSLLVIFGKPNMKSYQCFWYMAFGGGLATLIYPDFFTQTNNFFQLNICTSYFHHAFVLLLSLTMLQFGWFRPNLKKCYYFPMMFCSYIVVGAFEWHVMDIKDAMNLTEPLLKGTPLNVWFVWSVASVLIFVISLVYELVTKRRNEERKERRSKQ